MPEPPRKTTPIESIRRAAEEASRRLPTRVRELPSLTIRTAVIGVGKLLPIADQARKEYDELRRSGVRPTLDRLRRDGFGLLRSNVPTTESTHTQTGPEAPTETAETQATAERSAAAEPGGRSPTDQPTAGDGRPAPVEYPPAEGTTAAAPAGADTPRPVSGQDTPHLPEQAAAVPARDELPLANYDQLTVASLRARLRNLTITDLGVLLAHERTHQNRPNVVTMFENRILKLEREQGT